ncbi:MAG: hypothetical protein E7260_09360 [Lachnospiraceae bacterium]|nr:hypothetical protein [Lachnospiraceae bacterium]
MVTKLEEIAKVLQCCIDDFPYADPQRFFCLHGEKVSCLMQFVECSEDDSYFILFGLWKQEEHPEEITEVSQCDFVGHVMMSGKKSPTGGFYPEKMGRWRVRADIKKMLKLVIIPILQKGEINFPNLK